MLENDGAVLGLNRSLGLRRDTHYNLCSSRTRLISWKEFGRNNTKVKPGCEEAQHATTRHL